MLRSAQHNQIQLPALEREWAATEVRPYSGLRGVLVGRRAVTTPGTTAAPCSPPVGPGWVERWSLRPSPARGNRATSPKFAQKQQQKGLLSSPCTVPQPPGSRRGAVNGEKLVPELGGPFRDMGPLCRCCPVSLRSPGWESWCHLAGASAGLVPQGSSVSVPLTAEEAQLPNLCLPLVQTLQHPNPGYEGAPCGANAAEMHLSPSPRKGPFGKGFLSTTAKHCKLKIITNPEINGGKPHHFQGRITPSQQGGKRLHKPMLNPREQESLDVSMNAFLCVTAEGYQLIYSGQCSPSVHSLLYWNGKHEL